MKKIDKIKTQKIGTENLGDGSRKRTVPGIPACAGMTEKKR